MSAINIAPGPGFGSLIVVPRDASSWSDRALVNTDTNNWAPRFGLAYRLSDRWVLRAAAGTFYGGQENLGAAARPFLNWPFTVSKTLQSTKTVPALVLAQGVPPNFLDPGTTLPANSSIQLWDRNFPLPTIYQWNFSAQHQLTKNAVAKAAYVGSSGSYIRGVYNWNSPLPGDPATEIARRPLPNLSTVRLVTPYGHSTATIPSITPCSGDAALPIASTGAARTSRSFTAILMVLPRRRTGSASRPSRTNGSGEIWKQPGRKRGASSSSTTRRSAR